MDRRGRVTASPPWPHRLLFTAAILVAVGLLLLWFPVLPTWIGGAVFGLGVIGLGAAFGIRGRDIRRHSRRWSPVVLIDGAVMAVGGAMGLVTLWLSGLQFADGSLNDLGRLLAMQTRIAGFVLLGLGIVGVILDPD